MLLEKCLNGSVRLAGSDFSRHGRVEVCLGGDWGTVCNETVDSAAASVICRQLGFSPYGRHYSIPYNTYIWR